MRRYFADFAGLTATAEAPDRLTDQPAPLVEGSLTTAAVFGSEQPAQQAEAAARIPLAAAQPS